MALFRKSYSASLAIIALLFHALLPAFLSLHLSLVKTDANASPLFGEKVLICTPDGFRLVALSDLQKGAEPSGHKKDYKCPLCYLAGQVNSLEPPLAFSVPIFSSSILAVVPRQDTHDILSSQDLWLRRQTRSPPHSFIM